MADCGIDYFRFVLHVGIYWYFSHKEPQRWWKMWKRHHDIKQYSSAAKHRFIHPTYIWQVKYQGFQELVTIFRTKCYHSDRRVLRKLFFFGRGLSFHFLHMWYNTKRCSKTLSEEQSANNITHSAPFHFSHIDLFFPFDWVFKQPKLSAGLLLRCWSFQLHILFSSGVSLTVHIHKQQRCSNHSQ